MSVTEGFTYHGTISINNKVCCSFFLLPISAQPPAEEVKSAPYCHFVKYLIWSLPSGNSHSCSHLHPSERLPLPVTQLLPSCWSPLRQSSPPLLWAPDSLPPCWIMVCHKLAHPTRVTALPFKLLCKVCGFPLHLLKLFSVQLPHSAPTSIDASSLDWPVYERKRRSNNSSYIAVSIFFECCVIRTRRWG